MLLFTTLHLTEDNGLSDKPFKSQIWAAMFVIMELFCSIPLLFSLKCMLNF